MIEFISLQKITEIPDGDTVIQIPESHVMISTGQVKMKPTGIPQQIFGQYITPFTYKRKIADQNGFCKWMPVPRSVAEKTLAESEINFLAATLQSMSPVYQSVMTGYATLKAQIEGLSSGDSLDQTAIDSLNNLVNQIDPVQLNQERFTSVNTEFSGGTRFEMAQTLGIPLDQIVPFTNLILNSVILESVNGGFKAKWQNLNFVTEYIMQYRLQGATEWVTVPVVDALTHLDEDGFVAQTIEPLAAGTYESHVKAVDAYREGEYSLINTVVVG